MFALHRSPLTALALAVVAAGASAQSADDVKSTADRAVRWLRGQQDLSTGAYGSVSETAWTLRALAESPREYRPGDGPLVARGLDFLESRRRNDGAVCDAGATPQQAVDQSWTVVLAFGAYPEGVNDELLGAALRFANDSELSVDPAIPAFPTPIANSHRARARAAELAESQADAGWWGAEEGSVEQTAKNVIELGIAYRLIQAAEPPAPRGEIVALPEFEAADRARTQEALRRGAAFLMETSQGGRWGAPGQPDAGLTAMALTAIQAIPTPRDERMQAAIDAGLDWLVGLQHEDGSIHDGKLANYITSSSIMALARANRPGDVEVIARARAFLETLQSDEGEGYDEGDRYYGGIGYGSDERPDLSNLQMAMDALAASGSSSDDATMQKTLAFLQRCQNRSESNDVSIATGDVTIVSANDGGAGYAPGDSKAGFVELPDGTKRPRSYGSMTYALLKGYVFAGLPKDDPRVVAAFEWLCNHYSLDVNPGFESSGDPKAPYQGLFYYYVTMARTLDAYGAEQIVDAVGTSHPWRRELSGRVIAMQRPDGSWLNANSPRWWEGNPVLATAYAMQALDAALPRE